MFLALTLFLIAAFCISLIAMIRSWLLGYYAGEETE